MRSAEHDELCAIVVEQHLGPQCGVVYQTLQVRGDLTLKELRDAIADTTVAHPSNRLSMDDNSVRASVAALLRHGYLLEKRDQFSYEIVPYVAFARLAAPALTGSLAESYGDVGELVPSLLGEYAYLPQDTLEGQVLRLAPSLHAIASRSIAQMIQDGVLVAVGPTESYWRPRAADGSDADTLPPPEKRPRLDDAARAPTQPGYVLNVGILLWKLRTDLLLRHVAVHFPGEIYSRVIRALLQLDMNRRPRVDAAGAATRIVLPEHSTQVTRAAIEKRVNELGGTVSSSAVLGALSALAARAPGFYTGAIVQSTSGASETYCVSYGAAMYEMQKSYAESVVARRHGILGVRLMKILHDRGPMEDRFLAEEALVTQADVRTVLNNMLKDGYTRLIELPRVPHTAESRNTRNAVFLWAIGLDRILRTVRTQTAKMWLTTRKRIEVERVAMEAALPANYFAAGDRSVFVLSAQQEADLMRYESAFDALTRAATAITERLALLELFSSS